MLISTSSVLVKACRQMMQSNDKMSSATAGISILDTSPDHSVSLLHSLPQAHIHILPHLPFACQASVQHDKYDDLHVNKAGQMLLIKIRVHLKNKCGYWHPPFWSAYAYFEAREVLRALHMLHDAAHAIVAAMTAFGSKPNFAQRQVKVVIYHQHPLWWNLHPMYLVESFSIS